MKKEQIKIKKEVKFLESINKWCVGIWCPTYEYWTGGFFHKKLDKAEEMAMDCLKNGIDFRRELNEKAKIKNETLEY